MRAMNEEIEESSYQLLFPFLDESSSFAMGFECGKVYGAMKAGMPTIEGTYHLQNFEQFKLMAESAGYTVTKVSGYGEESAQWVDLTFTREEVVNG